MAYRITLTGDAADTSTSEFGTLSADGTTYPCEATGVKNSFIENNLVDGDEVYSLDGNPKTRTDLRKVQSSKE